MKHILFIVLLAYCGNVSAKELTYSQEIITDPVEARLIGLVRMHSIKSQSLNDIEVEDFIDGKKPAIKIISDSEFEAEVRAITVSSK